MTRDSHQVDARYIDMESEKSRFSSICEVFRYALKFGEMEIEDQVHAYKVLHGQRFVFSFGDLHGVPEPKSDNDTVEAALALLPYIDIVYKYIDATGFTFYETTDLGKPEKKVKPGEMKAAKAVRKLAKKKVYRVKDLEKPWQTVKADLAYVKQWAGQAHVEDTFQPEEVPF